MSYRLSFSETPAGSVERVRREQLEGAAAGLREHGEDPVEAVHDARKRLKKTRALLRLARPVMSDKAFRARNRALRDTGRALSGARDADVMAETVEDLAERYAGRVPKAVFTATHEPLAARARASQGTTDPDEAAAMLSRLAGARWPLEDLTVEHLQSALRQTYARGRKDFQRAHRKPTTENLHEWRKRVKDLWYQEKLLEESWPGVMGAQAKEAKKLSKLLGEDHDLAVLAELLASDPSLTAAASADREALLAFIAKRRKKLLKRSRALGRRVYAERPKHFARRSGRYLELA